jgi:thioredoxin 1
MVVEIADKKQFEKEVLKAKELVIVDFWAPWCGPCKMLKPIFEKVAEDYKGKVKFVKIDIDENPDVAQDYSVMSIPALKIFKGGEVVDEKVGMLMKDQLKSFIEGNL